MFLILCKYTIIDSFPSRKKSPPVRRGVVSEILFHGLCVVFFLFQLFFGKA